MKQKFEESYRQSMDFEAQRLNIVFPTAWSWASLCFGLFVRVTAVMALVVANDEADYSIKPEAVTPAVDTSSWPLLLRSYDKRTVFLL